MPNELINQLKLIECRSAPYRVRSPDRRITVEHRRPEPVQQNTSTRHQVQVSIGVESYLRDYMPDIDKQRAAAEENMRAIVIDFVYGDVRRQLMQMWGDIYNLKAMPRLVESLDGVDTLESLERRIRNLLSSIGGS